MNIDEPILSGQSQHEFRPLPIILERGTGRNLPHVHSEKSTDSQLCGKIRHHRSLQTRFFPEAFYNRSSCTRVPHENKVGRFPAQFPSLLVDRVRIEHLPGLEPELIDQCSRHYGLKRIVQRIAFRNIIFFRPGLSDTDLPTPHVSWIEIGNL